MDKEQIKQQASALKQQGFSTLEISNTLGVSVRTIQRYLTSTPTAKEGDLVVNKENYSVNDKIDNRLRILSMRGQATKYQCLGVISEYSGLNLTVPEQKAQAEKLFDNARKRLYRRKEEFHIVPEFIAKATDAENMLTHFYDESHKLWDHLEQAIESIVSSHYTQENTTRLVFQIRYELSKALCLPHATFTERERANTRQESYWRVAELSSAWKNGQHATTTFEIENTKEQLKLQQDLMEANIEETIGIAKEDIPY